MDLELAKKFITAVMSVPINPKEAMKTGTFILLFEEACLFLGLDRVMTLFFPRLTSLFFREIDI